MVRTNIGLKRGSVRLVWHSEQWHRLFLKEKDRLSQALGPFALGIEHIGSTAICSLSAKPIIDIDVGIGRLKIARKKQFRKKLITLGYQLRHTAHTESLYVLGPESQRTHYLHIVRYQGRKWNNDLVFRDALATNKKTAQRYEKLKQRLADRFPGSRASYTRGKRLFIQNTLREKRH